MQWSRDDNQIQMTSYLKEPRDSNPITKAQIRPDRLFTTTSSTNKHAAYTHSAEALLHLVHVFFEAIYYKKM